MGSAHAFLCGGGIEVIPAIRAFIEKEGSTWEGNPDIYVREYIHFGADEARAIRDKAQTRALGEKGRVFVIVTPIVTTEAQNALLKTFEEPPAGARFFLVVPSPHTLLSTLRSRAETFSVNADVESPIDMKVFLKAPQKERLELIKPLYDHGDDERDLRKSSAFLAALERELAKNVVEPALRESIESLYRARKYLNDKGSLLKVLLESVALAIPKM